MEEIEVSTGVKFEIGVVPIMTFREVQRKLEKERPRVPIVFITDKERNEENPNDPDYLEELENWNAESQTKIMDFALMTGTSVSFIPEGIEPIESNGWEEQNRFLGIDIAPNGKIRYLQWLKFVACPRQEDIADLILAAMRNIGVPEQDVAEAAALFQDRKERPTD